MNEKDMEAIYNSEFLPKVHFWGRLTLWIAVALCLLPCLYLSFVLGFHPGWGVVGAGFVGIAAAVGSAWFVEPISYFPILGISGTYMSFLAGNISNMRLPCAAAAQNALKTKPGSRKAEMVGILGIASSIVINVITLTLLVLIGTVLVANLPPVVKESFVFVLPGVFGAMFMNFAMKGPIYALFALPIGIALNFADFIPVWAKTPIAVFASIGIGILYYRSTQKAKA